MTSQYEADYCELIQDILRDGNDRHIQEDHEGTPQVGSRL